MIKTNLGYLFGNTLWQKKYNGEKAMTRQDVCDAFGIAPSSLSRMLNRDIPSRQLVEIFDYLGYDLEIVAVRKERSSDNESRN